MEKDLNTQQGSEKKTENNQGGFVAVLHKLEEKFYGPDSALDGKGRVLLYLRHRALRDWTQRKQIPKSEIMAATGIDSRFLNRALRDLEKEKHILVIRSKTGKIWNDNIYELHPERYGTDYVLHKQSFAVIYGGKAHKSNPDRPGQPKLSTESKEEGGVVVDRPLGVVVDRPLGTLSNILESLGNLLSNNPLKQPIKKTLSEEIDRFNQGSESEKQQSKSGAAPRIRPSEQHEDPQLEKKRQFDRAKAIGVL